MNLFLCELCLARTVGVLSARAEWLSTHVNANFDAKYRLGPGPPTLLRPATCQCWAFLYPTLPPSAQLMCINKHRKQNRCILTIWGSNNVSVCNVGIFYPSNTMQMRGTQWRWTMWDTASFVFSNKGQMCHNLKLWYTTFSIQQFPIIADVLKIKSWKILIIGFAYSEHWITHYYTNTIWQFKKIHPKLSWIFILFILLRWLSKKSIYHPWCQEVHPVTPGPEHLLNCCWSSGRVGASVWWHYTDLLRCRSRGRAQTESLGRAELPPPAALCLALAASTLQPLTLIFYATRQKLGKCELGVTKHW